MKLFGPVTSPWLNPAYSKQQQQPSKGQPRPIVTKSLKICFEKLPFEKKLSFNANSGTVIIIPIIIYSGSSLRKETFGLFEKGSEYTSQMA